MTLCMCMGVCVLLLRPLLESTFNVFVREYNYPLFLLLQQSSSQAK